MEDESVLNRLEDSFLDLVDASVEFAPKLLAALLLVVVGFIVARLLGKLLGRLVDFIETSQPVVKGLDSLGIKQVDIDGVVTLLTRWTVMLIFLAAAVDVLGLSVLTDTFNSLVSFIPNILAASVVAALTLYFANVIKEVVGEAAQKAEVKPYKSLAMTAKVVVLIFGLPLAVAQLGLDLTIINNNITVIVAGFMLAFAIAFGWGGRDVAKKLVDDAYKNWKK